MSEATATANGRPEGQAEKTAVILSLVREGVSSRLALTRRTGYRSSTVSRIVSELIDGRVLRELPEEAKGRGRPPSRLEFDAACLGVLSVHLSGRTFHASLSDAAAQVVASRSVSASVDATNGDLQRILDSLVGAVLDMMPAAMSLAGAVCAFPGIIETSDRVWRSAARWPKLDALALTSIRQPRAGDIMLVRNLDAEHRSRLAAWPDRSSILFHWGYGISLSHADGSGLSHARNPYGEVGHWQIGTPRGGQLLEDVASLAALLPALRRTWPRLSSDEETFALEVAELELAALKETLEAIEAIVTCLVNVGRIFFPDVILLSGPFGANRTVMAEIEARFPDELMRGVRSPRIVPVSGSLERERLGIVRPLIEQALQRYCSTGQLPSVQPG